MDLRSDYGQVDADDKELDRKLRMIAFGRQIACGGLLVVLSSVSILRADDTAAPNIGTNMMASFTGTLGWEFFHTGPHYYIYVTRLGVYDSGADGLANAHVVGLWTSEGSLLVSASIPAGTDALLENGYRYVSIDPVTLIPSRYVIAAQYSAGDADLQRTGWAAGLGPEINFPFSDFQLTRYAVGAGLPFPTNQTGAPQCEGCGPTVAWVANFKYSFVAPPLSPSLGFRPSQAALAIRWPMSATNFVLEAASTFSPPVAWRGVTNSTEIVDGLFSVTVAYENQSRFFRLREVSSIQPQSESYTGR